MADSPRPLTDRERRAIDHLLRADFPEAGKFRRQAHGARVIEGAPPPSIEIRVVKTSSARALLGSETLVHTKLPVEARSPNCDVLLFATAGWLDYMEIVIHDPSEAINEVPPPEQLDVWTPSDPM